MKKLLVALLSVLVICVLGSAAVFAAKYNPNIQPTTIAEVQKNAYDDQHVAIDGKFVKHLYKDVFTFRDTAGTEINVEVDDDCRYILEMDTPVRILAEVDKDWYGIDLEVKRIQKL
ncbi:MAG TPA: NirD/YgiW/YdeI family stress tolerance protein [Candidatus Megamonas gallistercoris]|nr:NirD/YgiW/YdeI family stress tolerance protein [Candidatus Megamonas gallistercoris]